MALSITQRPSITDSNWNAAHNPVLYKFMREDYAIGTITSGTGGRAQLTITGVNVITSFLAGDDVYFKDLGSYAAGVRTTVFSNATFSGGNTVILLSSLYIAALTTSGYINLITRRADHYRIEIEVFKASDDTSLNGIQFSYSPKDYGECNVDIGPIVRAYLNSDWTSPVDTGNDDNEIDVGASLKVYIKSQELYKDSATSVVSDSANPIFVVNAAMQFGDTDGGNMKAYVPKLDETKKFLTKFDNVRLYRGYPSTISFIFNDLSSVDPYDITIDWKDETGATITSETLSQDDSKIDTINRRRIHIYDDFKFATIKLITGLYNLLEITAIIEDPCLRPVFLVWKNSLGGDACWMFQYNQELSIEISGGAKSKSMRLFADNITLNEWEAIAELLTPNENYIQPIEELTSSLTGNKFKIGQYANIVDSSGNKTSVIVRPESITTQTKNALHSIAFDIELPEIFTQS